MSAVQSSPDQNRESPSLTVVIPTRSRAGSLEETVRALLANQDEFEIVVVDQSDDDATQAMVASLGEPKIRYLKTATRGVSAARNIGIREAMGSIIALTDDDCTVPADWIRELIAAFAIDHRIGVVFGNVIPAPHDPATGFIPAYVRDEPALARRSAEKHRTDGMSACMGVRRSVWRALSGFDEMLGVGAPLKSAAEGDFALRALQRGHFVYETPLWAVVHRGFRNWDDGRRLIHGYLYGTGAMLAKPVKLGERGVYGLLVRFGWRWAFGRSPVDLATAERRLRWDRLIAFVRGFTAGVLSPIDRSTGHYIDPQDPPGAHG